MIDSENVGSTWVSLLQEGKQFDLYIFVTENAKSLNFSLLKELTGDSSHKINIIECESGRNSLDFYLSSYLGYLIGRAKHSSYVVVSQDTGFDHVIDYWKRNGVDVVRINTKPEKQKRGSVRTRKQEEEPKKNSEIRRIVKREIPAAENKKQPVQKKAVKTKNNTERKDASASKKLLKNLLKDLPENEIEDIDRCLSGVPTDKRSDKNFIYRRLVRKYKSEKGLEIYTLIKKELDKYYRNI